jgi:hypothetical protein
MKRASLLAVFCLLACSSSSSSPTNATPPPEGGDAGPSADAAPSPSGPSPAAAEKGWWDALHAADPKAGAAAIAQLQAVYDANPKHPRNTMILAATNMWLAAEAGRDPTTAAQIGQTYGPPAARYFQEAQALNPNYGFITGFVGFLLFDQGSQTNNAAMVSQGKQLIDQGLQQLPIADWFFELLEAERVPPNDPQVQKTIDAAWASYETCAGQPLDHKNPDFSAYFKNGQGVQFCSDDDKVPFGVEGLLLHFGDLLVKQGSVDVAKAVYQAAQSRTQFQSWPHKDTLSARLTSDLNARAAAYQGDPKTWPSFGEPPYSCTICHGVSGK